MRAIERAVEGVEVGAWLASRTNDNARLAFGIAAIYIGRALADNLFVCVTGPKDPLATARVPEANAVRDVNTIRATLELDKSERTQRWLEREAAKPPPPRPPLKARRKSGAKTPHEAPPSPDRGDAAPPTADPPSAERRARRDGKAAACAALDEGAAQGAAAAAGIAAAAVEASPPEPQDLVARAVIAEARAASLAGRLAAAEERATVLEARATELGKTKQTARAAKASARADAATRRATKAEKDRDEAVAQRDGFEAAALARERAHARAVKDAEERFAYRSSASALVWYGEKEELEKRARVAIEARDVAAEACERITAQRDEWAPFFGPAPPDRPTGRVDFKVYDGAIIPRWAHRLRLGRITQYLRRELGGPDGVAYEIARRATMSKSAIEQLSLFRRYNTHRGAARARRGQGRQGISSC